MKLRKKSWWSVPLYCAVSSWISFYLTVFIGARFYVVKSIDASGVTKVEMDPVRVVILNAVLFLLVLVVGGLLFRRMTRAELALPAAIASGIYLFIVVCQLRIPSFPLSLSLALAYVQNWTGTLASFLMKLGLGLNLSVILSSFAPLLFVPFGRKKMESAPEVCV